MLSPIATTDTRRETTLNSLAGCAKKAVQQGRSEQRGESYSYGTVSR